jgi:hypothetical protein
LENSIIGAKQMSRRPYFTITSDSFEKNAGYKSTVHALAELIDNSFEAEASKVVIVLQVDISSNLQRIAVVDNGLGMDSELLQMAICEKAGTYMHRQRSSGSSTRKKLGKYGVGLPKASISQCNQLTVWSWTHDGYESAYRNGIDINDENWIKEGAEVDDSEKEAAPNKWVKCSGFEDEKHGTMVLWEDLDGLTWTRARWGRYSGLIPNLEFEVGRVYRKLLNSESYRFEIKTIVINNSFKILEEHGIQPNDPLYLTKGQDFKRKRLTDGTFWPPDDPIFDETCNESMAIELPLKDGTVKTVTVRWRCSSARRNTFAKLDGVAAGSLPHGIHARRNVGLSLLREGREVSMSMALAVPSEPRERWFGVEIEIPHELDTILGMTNNKQEYTRLENVLQRKPEEYIEDNETSNACLDRIQREDNNLSVCLRIAWKTQELWTDTKTSHKNMRVEHKKAVTEGEKTTTEGEEKSGDPESKAEKAASNADPPKEKKPETEQERETLEEEYKEKLKEAGLPENEAEQIAARIVDKGLSYAIAHRKGLGSPFFNVTNIKGVKFIELNSDHPAHKYIKSSMEIIDSDDVEVLKEHMNDSKTAIHLMLEAWAKTELEILIDQERRRVHRMREDWGRSLEDFIVQIENNEGEE